MASTKPCTSTSENAPVVHTLLICVLLGKIKLVSMVWFLLGTKLQHDLLVKVRWVSRIVLRVVLYSIYAIHIRYFIHCITAYVLICFKYELSQIEIMEIQIQTSVLHWSRGLGGIFDSKGATGMLANTFFSHSVVDHGDKRRRTK